MREALARVSHSLDETAAVMVEKRGDCRNGDHELSGRHGLGLRRDLFPYVERNRLHLVRFYFVSLRHVSSLFKTKVH